MYSQEEYINKLFSIYGNKYDYSQITYTKMQNYVLVKCNVCENLMKKKAYSFLQGSGCSKCSNKKRITTEIFKERASKLHDGRYDYSNVHVNGVFNKVKIICLKHGVFEQSVKAHLRGEGCLRCSGKHQFTKNDFIDKANLIHANKYNYNKTNYVKSQIKVDINCVEHGYFKQKPNDHLSGHGCPKCSETIGEKKIREFLIKNKIEHTYQKQFLNCKNVKNLRYDFYIPHMNILIEYDGVQHFKEVKFFGGFEALKKTKQHDTIKNDFAKKNDFNLVRITYENINDIEIILGQNIAINHEKRLS